jgi:hypothetical protein
MKQLAALHVCYFALLVAVFAEVRPEPGSVQVPLQQEAPVDSGDETTAAVLASEEGEEPTGFLRALVAGLSPDGRYALGLAPAGQSPPQFPEEIVDGFVWLNRGLRAGDVRDYVEVPVGVYDLVLLEEDVEQFTSQSSEFAPPSWQAIKSKARQPVRVVRHGVQTAVLFLDAERPETVVFDDRFDQTGAGRLRLVNLTENRQGRLSLMSGGDEKTLAANLPSRHAEVALPGGLRAVSYIAEWPGSKPESTIRQFFDVDHSRNPAITLVVMNDRYGRITGQLLRDRSRAN